MKFIAVADPMAVIETLRAAKALPPFFQTDLVIPKFEVDRIGSPEKVRELLVDQLRAALTTEVIEHTTIVTTDPSAALLAIAELPKKWRKDVADLSGRITREATALCADELEAALASPAPTDAGVLHKLARNLRNRAHGSERGGHHSVEWCNGVRFAANEAEALAATPAAACATCGGSGGERWLEPDGSENGERCSMCDGFGTATVEQTPAAGGDGIGDAARLKDYPTLLAFFHRHALGNLAAPSCLCCGNSMKDRKTGVQHLELPSVVICSQCKAVAEQTPAAGGDVKMRCAQCGYPKASHSALCATTEAKQQRIEQSRVQDSGEQP